MHSTLCTAPMRHPRAAGDPAVTDIGPAMVQVARRHSALGMLSPIQYELQTQSVS